uniref:Ionotropic glutamate receptor L-glutamate and glycine-binding domain-containing protein n=1 Tax=Strigamia maritima TaxID=126957 RepID=T1JM19_STRMM
MFQRDFNFKSGDSKDENLQRPIRITAIQAPPTIILNSKNKSSVMRGFLGHIFNIFNAKFNKSFEIFRCKDNQYGAFVNNSWSGMIGDLVRGAADIAPAVIISKQRGKVVKFSPQIYPFQLDIIYRQSDQHKRNYTLYLQPCNIEMCMCIFAISLLVILVKVFANQVSKKKKIAMFFRNLIDEVLLCWPIVLQVDSISFSFKSMKLVFGIYIAFSMLLFISYTSILTSLLAINHTKILFSSLEDVFVNPNVLPVIWKGGKPEEIFQKPSPYENRSVLRVPTLIEATELVFGGKYVFLHSIRSIQHLIDKNCSFAVAPGYISRDSVGLAYSKQFAQKDYFDFKILLLKQYGILSIEYKRFFPGMASCLQLQNSFNPILFGQIIGPIIVMVAGIFLSLIFAIFELIVDKFFK